MRDSHRATADVEAEEQMEETQEKWGVLQGD